MNLKTYSKSLMLKGFKQLGMNINSDRYILPEQYSKIESEPYYKGDGKHSVKELQEICKQYKEYCHQQNIIKQVLIHSIES